MRRCEHCGNPPAIEVLSFEWLIELEELVNRYPELGVEPDLAHIDRIEAWCLYQSLRKRKRPETNEDSRP